MSIIRKEINMIKATIKNETKRNIFAKAGAKKIAGGFCSTKKRLSCGVILDQYKVIATGTCLDKEIKQDLSNVLLFKKQKEVA